MRVVLEGSGKPVESSLEDIHLLVPVLFSFLNGAPGVVKPSCDRPAFLAEFAVKDDHRHALGLADEIIDASLKFQGGKIV